MLSPHCTALDSLLLLLLLMLMPLFCLGGACVVETRCPTVAQVLTALHDASIVADAEKAAVRVIRPANLGQVHLRDAADQQLVNLSAVESAVQEGYFLMRRCAGVPQFIVELSDDGSSDAPPRFVDNGLGSSFLFDLFVTQPSHWLVQRLDEFLGGNADE